MGVVPDFSSLSEDDWEELEWESRRTGEPLQFVALRWLERQATLDKFK